MDNVEYSGFSGWVDPPSDIRLALAGDITCGTVAGGGMNGMQVSMRLIKVRQFRNAD